MGTKCEQKPAKDWDEKIRAKSKRRKQVKKNGIFMATIKYIQLDDDTQAKFELASSYQTCRANVDFIWFLELISLSSRG